MIGCGYTCIRINFQDEGNLSYYLEGMSTFNVSNLSPFDVGDDLRTNPLQEEGNEESAELHFTKRRYH